MAEMKGSAPGWDRRVDKLRVELERITGSWIDAYPTESAEQIMRTVFPELLAGTHAVLPVEATEEMQHAAEDIFIGPYDNPVFIIDAEARNLYAAMVAAYLKAEKQR